MIGGYRYPDTNSNALDNISLQIKSGESIGLIGPSGVGKTTVVDIMLGLIKPISEITLMIFVEDARKFWNTQVAYCKKYFLDDSLRKNIALGVKSKEIDESKINYAIDKARLNNLVSELTDGLNTKIGERGIRLSGGQRQRIALARAFYHQKEVLVMDEATSALDNESEREIVETIKTLKGQKTIFVIAHRLTTVENCDKIYRLGKFKSDKLVDLNRDLLQINKSELINY